jgi:hypothetical protein
MGMRRFSRLMNQVPKVSSSLCPTECFVQEQFDGYEKGDCRRHSSLLSAAVGRFLAYKSIR